MLPYTIRYFFSGVLVDKYGSRWVITGLMVLMAAATLITGLATSLNVLLAGRLLLGIAESGIVPAICLSVNQYYPVAGANYCATFYRLDHALYQLALGILYSGYRRGVIGLLWFIASRRAPVAVESQPAKPAEPVITMG